MTDSKEIISFLEKISAATNEMAAQMQITRITNETLRQQRDFALRDVEQLKIELAKLERKHRVASQMIGELKSKLKIKRDARAI